MKLSDLPEGVQQAIEKALGDLKKELESAFLEYFTDTTKGLSPNDYDAEEIAKEFLQSRGLKGHRDTIEALVSIVPKRHIKPNNKLANEITRNFINEGQQELLVSREKSKLEIVTRAMLTYTDEKISLSGRPRFTSYDREVHDGVVTLYEAGNRVITPSMVYRAMNGMADSEKISPQAVGAVTRSLDKSRRIMVYIDFSQEARAYNNNCKATYEGYLLACDKVTVTTSGKTQEAYKLLRKPIIYEYSQVSKQIINIPISLLQTRGAVRGTEEVIVIRGYLLRQIMGMKSKTFARSNKITFAGIYEELDITTDEYSEAMYKKKTHATRRHVEALLTEWKEQGFIESFDIYKEGRLYKGVVINL